MPELPFDADRESLSQDPALRAPKVPETNISIGPPRNRLPAPFVDGMPLTGETVAFTGKLWSLGRKEAHALVEQLGGAAQEELTVQTTMLVLGAETYPDGAPDAGSPPREGGTRRQKLRRAAEIATEQSGQLRVITEDAFCRIAGLPEPAEIRTQHYGQRAILVMYPLLREDHLRYLQKWGLLRPAVRNNADTWFTFAGLTLLRQVHGEMAQGASFRSVLRDLQAAQSGQLAFDFRLDAQPARILALKPRVLSTDVKPTTAGSGSLPRSPSKAEEHFLAGSLLDDGSPEQLDEAAQAYRRALDEDPDLVAALINLANVRYARDELAEAQALYERAIMLDPAYFEAHFNLGNIHHDYGRHREAERCYLEALDLNPDYAEAHFYLAVTLEKAGRSPDARAHWREYQRLAPHGEWVELAKEFSE